MNDLVTIEEFKKQIWDIEGVKVEINFKEGDQRLVRPYNYSKLPDDAVVDDLKERINECLKPFITFVEL